MTTIHQLPGGAPVPDSNPGDVYGVHQDHRGNKYQIRWSHHKGKEGYVAHNIDTHQWVSDRLHPTRRKALKALRIELTYQAKKAAA